jgi:ABC-type multidrug transport system fused ATPase/permease subunit
MNIPLARYWSLLAVYLKGQRWLFASLILVLSLSIAATILIPQITREFVDGAASGAELDRLFWLAVMFLSAAVAAQLFSIGGTWLGEIVAWNATNKLRIDLAEHCLNLDMAFHKDKTPGEMIERLDEDITSLARFFSQLVVLVGSNLLLVVGIIVMFLMESQMLGLVFAAFATIAIVVLNQLREIAIPHEVKRRKILADLFGFLEERLSGTEDIRANGAVDHVISGLFGIHSDLLVQWREVQLRYWALGTVSQSVITGGYCLALICGFYLYRDNAITIGTAFLIVQYMHILSRPLRQLSSQVEQLQGVGASVERIAELVDQRSALPTGDRQLSADNAMSLQFDHVQFSYEPEVLVLADVSFEVQAGSVLGVLGRTGSGKTTLTRLLCRLYDVNAGNINLNGVNVREISKSCLTDSIAMVTQDVQLFQASIRDNLTFFNHDISDERLVEVLQLVELGDWITQQPDGLDTMLESGGRSMSAGEAQLLAFARVFLRSPAIVVLDEASSRLDQVTEAKVERAIDHLLKDRTAIIIAHRLSTVSRADDILILDDGKVVEHGNRKKLLGNEASRLSQLMKVGLEEELA